MAEAQESSASNAESSESNNITAETSESSTEEPTYSQAQVEAIVKDRIKNLKTKYSDYDKLKQTASEVEAQRQATMSEHERAIELARTEGQQAARSEYAKLLAGAEVKAALSSIVENPEDVVSDLDLGKYITDEGHVDTDAVNSLKEKWVKLMNKKSASNNLGHGRNNSTPSSATSAEKFAAVMQDMLNTQ